MKCRSVRWMAALLGLCLLIPVHAEADDGGTEQWNAVLYGVVRQKTMAREDETDGFLTGTRVRILGLEIYDDVRFVPSGEAD